MFIFFSTAAGASIIPANFGILTTYRLLFRAITDSFSSLSCCIAIISTGTTPPPRFARDLAQIGLLTPRFSHFVRFVD